MNIIDAIKSGRKFRRPGIQWTYVDEKGGIVDVYGNGGLCLVSDLIADDWEVGDEEKIELSVSVLNDALCESYQLGRTSTFLNVSKTVQDIAEKLRGYKK